MNDDLNIGSDEIEALATKLDQLDELSDRERLILTGIFVLAGQAAADQLVDVSGFMPTAVERASLNFSHVSGLPSYLNGLLLPAVQTQNTPANPGGLVGSFSWGLHGAGGGGGAG